MTIKHISRVTNTDINTYEPIKGTTDIFFLEIEYKNGFF